MTTDTMARAGMSAPGYGVNPALAGFSPPGRLLPGHAAVPRTAAQALHAGGTRR